MKYCIGCVHLDIAPRDLGSMGSTWTGVYGDEEASMFCKNDHWREEMGTDASIETFRKCMEKAETCPDYSEREKGVTK